LEIVWEREIKFPLKAGEALSGRIVKVYIGELSIHSIDKERHFVVLIVIKDKSVALSYVTASALYS
jgi:hypothetical protein